MRGAPVSAKAGALQDGEELSKAYDQGLEAVQLLHTEYADLLARLRSSREVRTDRSRVAFSLGTVFVHKKFGYKGASPSSPCASLKPVCPFPSARLTN